VHSDRVWRTKENAGRGLIITLWNWFVPTLFGRSGDEYCAGARIAIAQGTRELCAKHGKYNRRHERLNDNALAPFGYVEMVCRLTRYLNRCSVGPICYPTPAPQGLNRTDVNIPVK
jgi:hypothetical protein